MPRGSERSARRAAQVYGDVAREVDGVQTRASSVWLVSHHRRVGKSNGVVARWVSMRVRRCAGCQCPARLSRLAGAGHLVVVVSCHVSLHLDGSSPANKRHAWSVGWGSGGRACAGTAQGCCGAGIHLADRLPGRWMGPDCETVSVGCPECFHDVGTVGPSEQHAWEGCSNGEGVCWVADQLWCDAGRWSAGPPT